MMIGPQFRLLRMIECHLNEGHLTNIDGLLGCAVYSPELNIADRFSSLPNKEQHVTLSCIFYTSNWFRELINAFATQKEVTLRVKVYARLRQVVKFQKLLCELLPKCPSYLPDSAFFSHTNTVINPVTSLINKTKNKGVKKAKKNPKGKKKDQDECISQGNTQNKTVFTQNKEVEKDQGIIDFSCYRPFLREFHLDVFNLLFRAISLDPHLEPEDRLILSELEFLLDDLNSKLEFIFETPVKKIINVGTTKKDYGFDNLKLFSAVEMATSIIRFLKPVCIHLESISELYQKLIADADGVLDSPAFFVKELILVNKVYNKLFTVIANVVSWPGFSLEQNSDILKKMIDTIAKRMASDDVSSLSLEKCLEQSFQYFYNYNESILNIKTAVTLVRVLKGFCYLDSSNSFNSSLITVVDVFLKRLWYTDDGQYEKGAEFNKNVYTLLETSLKYNKNKLDVLNNIVDSSLNEFIADPKKKSPCEVYQTLDRHTLPLFYRCILEYLVSAVKESLSNSKNEEEKFKVWEKGISIYHTLVQLLPKFDLRHLLTSCLNYSRGFLNLFLYKGMTLLDSYLKEDHNKVIVLLKQLQPCTRKLQNICIHSKGKKDSSLMRFVPSMKKILETLIYRVKAMVVMNSCRGAFCIGNLKNRDLQGNEIMSDVSRIEAEENESSDKNNESDDEGEDDDEESLSDVELDDESSSQAEEQVTEFSEVY